MSMDDYDINDYELKNTFICKDGRVRAYIRENGKKKVVSYPRIIMERFLGRRLFPDEQVHHKNENPLDNRIENLEVLHFTEHQRLHAQKYFDKTVKCLYCGKEFLWTALQQRYFHGNKNRKGHNVVGPFCSKSCIGKYGREIQMGIDRIIDNGE